MSANDNRIAGASFEKLFERQCLLAGLWAEPNYIKARRAWKGKLQALPSNLDYTVITRDGRVGFFDCKSFEGDYFTFSDLSDHQVELAARYNLWGVPAGFVVFFRGTDRICFFPGGLVRARGKGTRFSAPEGRDLGGWPDFDPKLLLEPFCLATGSASGMLA